MAPAAASAATYTVAAGAGPCGGADSGCATIAAAAGAAGAGDAVQIAPGTYTENATFGAGGVTVTGSTDAPGVVVGGTLTFSGGGGRASCRSSSSRLEPGAAPPSRRPVPPASRFATRC